jgi:hypothetical protein
MRSMPAATLPGRLVARSQREHATRAAGGLHPVTLHTNPRRPGQLLADQIRGLERTRLQALVARDMDTARRIHAADFQLITPRGHALTRDEYLDAVTRGEIRYLLWEPAAMDVRVHGGVALVRYRARLQLASAEPQRPPFECWHTDSYEQREGGWQVVWSQATRIG